MARKAETQPFYGISMNPFHLLIVIGITVGSYYIANTNWSFGDTERPLRHYYPIALGMHDLDTIYEHIPPFSLVDQKGENFTITRKDNLPFNLILTAYTSKEEEIESKKAIQLQKVQAFISDLEDIRMASIVVDSISQSPEQLKEIAQKVHAEEVGWAVVSGEWKQILFLLNNGMHLGVNKDSLTLKHPGRVVLIDKNGHTRGRYNGENPDLSEKLIADIKQLRKGESPKE